ncbi:hypothetical protein ART_1790 [Arthrobacter sp. PAMC 25486]|nr:hypothetical protein ART_1790 [Arthrobacter sp. PAMC 25486]
MIAEGPTPGTLIEQSTGSGKSVFNLSGLTDKQKLIGLVINCDGPGGWSAGISSEQGISGSGDCSPTNHGSMTFAPADPAEVSSVTVDVPAGTTFWITIYSNRQLAYDSIY